MLVELKSYFSFILSVSGNNQIRERAIENELVRETEGNCKEAWENKSSKKKDKCDKSSFLTINCLLDVLFLECLG